MNAGRGWLARRFQVIVLDEFSGRTARRFRVSPRAVLATALALILAGGAGGWLAHRPSSAQSSASDHQEKQALRLARNRLAESEAERRILQAQVTALKEELKHSRGEAEQLARRIRAYESILEARKTTGVRILRASARWIMPPAIAYDIVLVKGGNYPRRVAGSLRLIALDDDGRQMAIQASNDAPELPYRMETHTFLRGTIPWKEDWRPTRLRIIRLNGKGEARDTLDIVIKEKDS